MIILLLEIGEHLSLMFAKSVFIQKLLGPKDSKRPTPNHRPATPESF